MAKYLFMAVAMFGCMSATAQTLSLDSCRALAIRNNKELQMSALRQEAAHWQHKSAVTNYLPKITGVGTYQHTSRQISVLSDENQESLSKMGTGTKMTIAKELKGVMANNPSLAPMVTTLSPIFEGLLNGVGNSMDMIGQSLVDALDTDTRNLTVAGVMLTQPLYMGGKIRAYDKITRLAEQAAGYQHTMEEQDLLVSVDEAYWRIVSLQSKKQLAESFLTTVQKLDQDVERVIAEGMATKADGLSVKVKLNEAEVANIQVENGLTLSRMALAQLCGLPLDSQFTLADEAGTDVCLPSMAKQEESVETALQNRAELQALDIAAQVKRQQVNVARSAYLPNLMLTAGYTTMKPNFFNGFRRKFDDVWSVGVMLKVPIITWGDRIYKVRQAKAEAKIAETRLAEVREKVSLQVNQNHQKLQEAQKRYATALRSQEQADENLRMANLGMREGVIPVSNVLQAQTAWLSAHSTLVEAEIDVRLADLYLQRSMGTLRR